MTDNDTHAAALHRNGGPEHTPRLRLKPKAPATGFVDGAWWPHGPDLAAELPDLLSVLSVRLGPIQRVMYNLGEWARIPRRLATGGRSVRLDGYRTQPANTIGIGGLTGATLVLLVVPPDTESDMAHQMLMAAAASDDVSAVSDLLTVGVEAARA